MRTKSSTVAYVVAGISLCMLLIGSALASGPDVEPAAKKKILSIPAAAFNEIRWGDDWNTYRKGGLLRTNPNGSDDLDIGHYYAPVILPEKAKILEVRMISKNGDTPNISMQLLRNTVQFAQQVETTIVNIVNPEFSPNYTTRTKVLDPAHKVDNDGACYSIHLYLPDAKGTSVAFHHAEIVYTGKW